MSTRATHTGKKAFAPCCIVPPHILKHAAATEVLVQLVRQAPRLNVLVEDNGRGFDTRVLENNKGAGWTNIRSRVEYLKGKIDVHSELGKGTSVTIEFNI